ncbi:ead/Ea22-like family protein [Klebsiella pneumoniae]|uniref:ead/Ea22-like family protein n=1 Tax=Klebsiella pneumoniae TaxID=573 RepID=UPI003F8587AF
MTTDITELAQRMKAAAEKATPGPWYVHDKPCEDGNYGIDTSDKEFLAEAVVWWGFARQSIWREEDAKYIALANPANILALVEALEKAQAQSSKWLEAYHKAVSIGARYEERIAELESRTVKLPKPISVLHRREFTAAHCAIYAYPEAEVNAALAAAGIKVEAE